MNTLYKDTRTLEEQIAQLEKHIASRRAMLPYIDRGYFNEERAINELEQKLSTLKAQRDAKD